MKTTLLISLMCMASMAFAQTSTNTGHCKKYAEMPKGAVPAWPTSPYIALQDPECAPCYEYTRKSGLVVMECPGLYFLPDHKDSKIGAWQQPVTVNDNNMDVNTARAYSGNYPKVCKRDPHMPKGAVPVWPKSEYRSTQAPECAPCYEYTRKSGLVVMECPFALFPPEK